METLRRGVSDHYDSHAGRTVVGTMVRHMCPLKDTWKKMRDVLETGSQPERLCRTDNGPSHVSVGEHLGKNERPLKTGSLSSMMVVQDGPSQGRRSVTCVQ